MSLEVKLGVNLDHICVLREARKVNDPDIIAALYTAVSAKSDQITIHLREDRRHINENDVKNIINLSKIPVNVECSINEQIINIVSSLKPHRATLVPEKREELTTEGGLDPFVDGIKCSIDKLKSNDIEVSMFIEPNKDILQECANLGCDFVELHTGRFANIFLMLNSNLSYTKDSILEFNKSKNELKILLNNEILRIQEAANFAHKLGLKVGAGHGLNYQNANIIANIDKIIELNIGQSIIARSVFCGLKQAINEMKEIIRH